MLPSVDHMHPGCYAISIGPRTWYISGSTVVAFRGPVAPQGIRIMETLSVTTARHMNIMGVAKWLRVSYDEFNLLAGV